MMEANWSNPESFWLNVTNAALGIATLVALLAVFGAVVVELYGRMKKGTAAETPDRTSKPRRVGVSAC